MKSLRPTCTVALFASLVAAMPTVAVATDSGVGHVYQQRTSDGRIVLTDDPAPAAQTQRVWAIVHEDPAAARLRSEQVRLEAQAVTERIQRRIDRQQLLARLGEVESVRSPLVEPRREPEWSRPAGWVVAPPDRTGRGAAFGPTSRDQRPVPGKKRAHGPLAKGWISR